MSHDGCKSEHPGQSMRKLATICWQLDQHSCCLGGQHRPATSLNTTVCNRAMLSELPKKAALTWHAATSVRLCDNPCRRRLSCGGNVAQWCHASASH
eukprot:15161406-Alexandrium_andersonii.AAC.1